MLWLGAVGQQAIAWTKVDQYHTIWLLGADELIWPEISLEYPYPVGYVDWFCYSQIRVSIHFFFFFIHDKLVYVSNKSLSIYNINMPW